MKTFPDSKEGWEERDLEKKGESDARLSTIEKWVKSIAILLFSITLLLTVIAGLLSLQLRVQQRLVDDELLKVRQSAVNDYIVNVAANADQERSSESGARMMKRDIWKGDVEKFPMGSWKLPATWLPVFDTFFATLLLEGFSNVTTRLDQVLQQIEYLPSAFNETSIPGRGKELRSGQGLSVDLSPDAKVQLKIIADVGQNMSDTLTGISKRFD